MKDVLRGLDNVVIVETRTIMFVDVIEVTRKII